MDPYDFAENGYRCTMTIGRLVPNVSWWFPSCNRCSKSCVPDGSGYRCNACSTNSFRFKYKISFVALDGTDEAEMICFGDVARRIIGKPVQQIIRTATNANTYPPDVTKIVSLRFTFQVSLTQQSYYRQQKTYQVVSVVTSHGQPNAIPHAPVNEGGAHPGTPMSDHSLIVTTDDGSELAQPNSVTDDGVPSLVAANTPPPSLRIDDTLPAEKKTGDQSAKTKQPSSRKRLTYGSDDLGQEEDNASAASLDGASIDTVTKRSRGASSVAHESG